jgi:hypothetical protein
MFARVPPPLLRMHWLCCVLRLELMPCFPLLLSPMRPPVSVADFIQTKQSAATAAGLPTIASRMNRPSPANRRQDALSFVQPSFLYTTTSLGVRLAAVCMLWSAVLAIHVCVLGPGCFPFWAGLRAAVCRCPRPPSLFGLPRNTGGARWEAGRWVRHASVEQPGRPPPPRLLFVVCLAPV